MQRYPRHVLTALVATAILASAISTASARNLQVSETHIRVVWAPLTFSASGLATVRCNVTLEGSFHSATIPKVVRLLIGHITRANVQRPCTGGTAWVFNGTDVNEVLGGTFANSLPWHITYEGFTGTLPTITGVRILLDRARFRLRVVEPFGVVRLCTYTTGVANGGNASGIAELDGTGRVTGLRADEGRSIRSEEGGFCVSGQFSGRGTATVLNSSTLLTIRLI
jgi:hypothetical protein